MVTQLGPSSATFESYFAALHAGDRDTAIALAIGELDRGASPEGVLLNLLVPAQSEVGRRWQEGGWSVAQEHQATSCSDGVLTAVTMHVASRPRPSHGRIVVACVEEEWHTLPTRIFAELLYLRGWRPSFLGASIPTESLASFLGNADPEALALSCSVAMNLTGAADCIEAAHSLRIPVLVGGRGFGDDARRACKLGADAWAMNLDDACDILETWVSKRPRLAAAQRTNSDDRALMAVRRAVVEAALADLQRESATVAALDRGHAKRLGQDLAIHLRFVEAALATADPGVYLDFISWDTWLAPGVAPVDGLTAAIVAALQTEVPPSHVAAHKLFARASAKLAGVG